MRDTVQAKLVELGLLQPDAGGTGWELTQQARELLSAIVTKPYKSTLAADLLALGMIEPAPTFWGTREEPYLRHLLHLLSMTA